MVVPYVKPVVELNNSKLQELDAKMTNILNDPKLAFDEKVLLYSQALSQYKENEKPTDPLPNLLSNILSQVTKLSNETQGLDDNIKQNIQSVIGAQLDRILVNPVKNENSNELMNTLIEQVSKLANETQGLSVLFRDNSRLNETIYEDDEEEEEEEQVQMDTLSPLKLPSNKRKANETLSQSILNQPLKKSAKVNTKTPKPKLVASRTQPVREQNQVSKGFYNEDSLFNHGQLAIQNYFKN